MSNRTSQQCDPIPPAAAATLACLYEATAPKPGNVHPQVAFEDATCYADFVASAVVVGPILGQAQSTGVGRTVLDAVRATQCVARGNTNLGTLLLLAPLAAVPQSHSLQQGIGVVIDGLTLEDTRLVYEAIRSSGAGGLGRAERADVQADAPPNLSLVDAMRLAADRDLVAQQYINQFADVFAVAAWIHGGLASGISLSNAIVNAHVRQLAAHPDTLIHRKCGPQTAREAGNRADVVLQSGSPGEPAYQQALAKLDAWLRDDGHRRNPGTTADFIAAGLFVLLREGRLNWHVW